MREGGVPSLGLALRLCSPSVAEAKCYANDSVPERSRGPASDGNYNHALSEPFLQVTHYRLIRHLSSVICNPSSVIDYPFL
jgi:hypothetical protein